MKKQLLDFSKHLSSRKLLSNTSIEPNSQFSQNSKSISAYSGYDPSADFLHLGNYLQIVTTARASLFGIKPIYLIGGATGRIGDPSFKSEQRKLLSSDSLTHNIENMTFSLNLLVKNLHDYLLRKSVIKNLDYKIVNNALFYTSLNFLDFLQKYGFNFNMATLLKRESVAKRLNDSENLTYSEFSYQVLQAIDFSTLNQKEV